MSRKHPAKKKSPGKVRPWWERIIQIIVEVTVRVITEKLVLCLLGGLASLALIIGGIVFYKHIHQEPAIDPEEIAAAHEPEENPQPPPVPQAKPDDTPQQASSVVTPQPVKPDPDPRKIEVSVDLYTDQKLVPITLGCERLTLTLNPQDGKKASTLELARLYGGDPHDAKKLKIYRNGKEADAAKGSGLEYYYPLESGASYDALENFEAGDMLRIIVHKETRFVGKIRVELVK